MSKVFNKAKITRPLVIAGPCSAESEEQVLETAEGLKDMNVDYYRAGIWKPRTRPGAFEGIGVTALPWLQKVKKQTGLKICTEVASTAHVFECMKAGVDMVWIGARTTTSPFVVQEIAEALRGTDIPVVVKNPINPDLKLWIGAIERLQQCGISDIAALHRGFSIYEKIQYRNEPRWQIAIDLQKAFPDLVLLGDPSHIGGKHEYIQELSQKSMDLNFDGLMIETHRNPEEAWTDARQQVTPSRLGEILNGLVLRDERPEGVSIDELEQLRAEINIIDASILDTMAKRMEISKGIGNYKKSNNMMVLQKSRWNSLLDKNVQAAEKANLSADFVTKLFKLVHQESINIQEDILTKQ